MTIALMSVLAGALVTCAWFFGVERGRRIVMQEQLGGMNALQLRYHELVDQVVRLKRKGFEPSTAGRIIKAPDPEANALKSVEEKFTQQLRDRRAEADREFEGSAVADLQAQGLSLDQAMAEARRLRGEVTDMHPGGG